MLRGIKWGFGALVGLMLLSSPSVALTVTPISPEPNADAPYSLLPNHLYLYLGTTAGPGASIDETFQFQFAGTSLGSSATATTLDPSPTGDSPYGIANLKLEWLGLGISTTFTDGNGILNSSAKLLATFLANGFYDLRVTGTALADGGFYNLRITTTPLPPALVLFGTALVGLTLLGRRRRASANPL